MAGDPQAVLAAANIQKPGPIRARLNFLGNQVTKIRQRTTVLGSSLYHDFGDRTDIGRKLPADAFQDSPFDPG